MTRRLADTAIEQSELYQAAKRDAEAAEAYAVKLEANIDIKADFIDATLNQLAASDQRIEELEAQLAKAVKALDRIAHVSDIYGVEANAEDQGAGTLAYAHKSTCNLARAALAELEQKP